MSKPDLRLGTRGSKLARWQAEWAAARLVEAGASVEIVEISTTGDVNQSHDVGAIGSLGLFTKELQQAMLDGVVDFAVHSLKDLPTTPISGLVLAAVPVRETVADVLVARSAKSLEQLPHAARVGTGSLRRRSQLLRLRPDLEVVDIRGNVDTRLSKLDEGQYDAIVLAAAGLKRLGLAERITEELPVEQMLPAPGQGALGIECCEGNEHVLSMLAKLDDANSRATVDAERTMLARVEGGCLAAIGAHATVAHGRLHLAAAVLSPDGTERLYSEVDGPIDTAKSIGETAGEQLLAQGASRLVQARR